MTKGVLEEKFVSEFFCPYFIGNLHAVTEHGEVVVKGVFAVNLLPDGLTGWCIGILTKAGQTDREANRQEFSK